MQMADASRGPRTGIFRSFNVIFRSSNQLILFLNCSRRVISVQGKYQGRILECIANKTIDIRIERHVFQEALELGFRFSYTAVWSDFVRLGCQCALY